jgi:hypothetical protein
MVFFACYSWEVTLNTGLNIHLIIHGIEKEQTFEDENAASLFRVKKEATYLSKCW